MKKTYYITRSLQAKEFVNAKRLHVTLIYTSSGNAENKKRKTWCVTLY